MNNDKLALVIGGSGDLGIALIDRLLSAGIKIISTYHTSIPNRFSSKNVTWIKYDPINDPTCGNIIEVINQRPINYLAFTLGLPSSKKNIVGTSYSEWLKLLQINAISFSQLYHKIYKFVRIGQGRVVVVSSDTTKKLKVCNGPYSASKAALEAIAITLSKEELPFGVRVNIFAPSLFESKLANRVLSLKNVTDISSYKRELPWGRAISLDEVADSIISILCDESWRYATGQVFRLTAER